MDGQQREFRKFKQFLDELYTRHPKAEDFQIEKYEYVQQHLEKLLPTLSLEDAKRIQIYFQNALLYHLNNGLNNKHEFTPLILSSDPIPVEGDVEVEPLQEPQQQTENVIQKPPVDVSATSQLPEYASHEPVHVFQRREPSPITQSTPVMQSTPLCEAYQTPVEEQCVQPSNEANQNGFIAYINSEINVPSAQTNHISGNLAEEVPFLRAFAHLEGERSSRHRPRMPNTPNRVRKRQGTNRVVPRRQMKKKKKNIQFDVLCSLQFKRKTEKQVLLSYGSFLYFPLLEKSKYRLERPAGSSPAPGHLSPEEIANFSFILRDHARQCQSPTQFTSERLSSTPANRCLRFLPFTSVRGSALGLIPNKAVSSSRRLMLTQQTLLTIRERESSIHIPPNVPIDENNMQFSVDGNLTSRPYPSHDDPSALSNIVRQPNSEIFEERSLPILQTDRSLPESGHNSLNLNESSIIQSLNVNAPLVPLEALQEQPEPNELPPPETLAMVSGSENQRVVTEGDSNVQVAAPEIDETNNNRVNWFEILRARNNLIEYAPDEATPLRRRKRRRRGGTTRRRRRSPPEIVARPSERPSIPLPEEIDPILDHVLPNLEIMNLEEVSIPQQQNVSELPSTSACQAPQQHYGGMVDRNEASKLFEKYAEVVKRVARKSDYTSWEYYDASLFNKTDNFEVYTKIFKRIIKDNYVDMEGLYESGTSRLDAARGFRFILELKAMNLIEIESIGTKIVGFRIKSIN